MSEEYSLHESLGYMLSLAARVQERRLEHSLKGLGLTRTGWCVLLAVGVEGLTNPSGIAAFVRIDRTAASRSLRQLEESGMIARQSGKHDRRTTTVELTAKGRRALESGIRLARANNAAMTALLGDRAEADLRLALGTLIDAAPGPLKLL